MKYPRPLYQSRLALHLQRFILLLVPLMMVGCNVDFMNARPARELTPPAKVGNLYAGWRVYQDKCSSCHGIAATSGISRKSQDETTVETRIDEVMRAGEPPIEMPTWQGEPAVNANILDLYTYLFARAEGRIGIGRPPYYGKTSAVFSSESAQ
ncbi:MAG: hypothetical protein EBV69_07805 [Oxalobacteraceae bacterium]|nr:hypothetical protein [Oxalobacteraceae bacterium]